MRIALPEYDVAMELGETEGSYVRTLASADLGLFGVARGSGGFCKGIDAAEITLATALEVFRSSGASDHPGHQGALATAIRLANDRVRQVPCAPYSTEAERVETQRHGGHGCSVALIGVTGDTLTAACCGDCEVYRFRPSERGSTLELRLLRVNTPQTISRGTTSEEAAATPHINVMFDLVGYPTRPWIDVHEVPHRPGDVFVVCTDRVARRVSLSVMRDLLVRTARDGASAVAAAIMAAASEGQGEPERHHSQGAAVLALSIRDAAPKLARSGPGEATSVQRYLGEEQSINPGVIADAFTITAEWGGEIIGAVVVGRCGRHGVLRALVTGSRIERTKNRELEAELLEAVVTDVRAAGLEDLYMRSSESNPAWVVPEGFVPVPDSAVPEAVRSTAELQRGGRDDVTMVRRIRE